MAEPFKIAPELIENDDVQITTDGGTFVLEHRQSGATFEYDPDAALWMPSSGVKTAIVEAGDTVMSVAGDDGAMTDKDAKVIGELAESDAIGLLGINMAEEGDAIGVYGETESDDGYGLYTPDDAHVGGELGAESVDATSVSTEELNTEYRADEWDSLTAVFDDAGNVSASAKLGVGTYDEELDLSTRTASLSLIGSGIRLTSVERTEPGDTIMLGDSDNTINGVNIHDLDANNDNTDGSWLKVQDVQNLECRNLYIDNAEHAFHFEQAGDRLIDAGFYECIAEACTDTGILYDVMQVASGRNIRRHSWFGGYSYGNGGAGLHIKGRGIQRCRWNDYEFARNDGPGAIIEGATIIRFSNCEFVSNGAEIAPSAQVRIDDDADGNISSRLHFDGCYFDGGADGDTIFEHAGSAGSITINGGRFRNYDTAVDVTGGADRTDFNISNVTGFTNFEYRSMTLSDGEDEDVSSWFDDTVANAEISPRERNVMAGVRTAGGTTFSPFLTDNDGNTLSDVDCQVLVVGETHPSVR